MSASDEVRLRGEDPIAIDVAVSNHGRGLLNLGEQLSYVACRRHEHRQAHTVV
jgi:hypothetical protein